KRLTGRTLSAGTAEHSVAMRPVSARRDSTRAKPGWLTHEATSSSGIHLKVSEESVNERRYEGFRCVLRHNSPSSRAHGSPTGVGRLFSTVCRAGRRVGPRFAAKNLSWWNDSGLSVS